jgi:hypothetical protein
MFQRHFRHVNFDDDLVADVFNLHRIFLSASPAIMPGAKNPLSRRALRGVGADARKQSGTLRFSAAGAARCRSVFAPAAFRRGQRRLASAIHAIGCAPHSVFHIRRGERAKCLKFRSRELGLQ